jgi:integration host factor subunit beta
MITLTKRDLAQQLIACQHEPELWMSQKSALDIIDTLTDLITLHFVNGGQSIVLRGFGTFKTKTRRAFIGYNPLTGDCLPVAAKKSVFFKPSAGMVRRIQSFEGGK